MRQDRWKNLNDLLVAVKEQTEKFGGCSIDEFYTKGYTIFSSKWKVKDALKQLITLGCIENNYPTLKFIKFVPLEDENTPTTQ